MAHEFSGGRLVYRQIENELQLVAVSCVTSANDPEPILGDLSNC